MNKTLFTLLFGLIIGLVQRLCTLSPQKQKYVRRADHNDT